MRIKAAATALPSLFLTPQVQHLPFPPAFFFVFSPFFLSLSAYQRDELGDCAS